MYNRSTELRHMRTNDVYKLGVILDDNSCWKKLMEIIPRELDALASSEDGTLDWERAVVNGFKYNNDHIRLIENAIKRPGESRLFAQILFDEWGTSGRKSERPTLGVLLQLLVKAELFRAADYVALHYLNEPPPERPLNGPAARIDITLSSDIFNDIEGLVNDTAFYPETEALNDNANYGNSVADNNKDFYSKYRMDKQVLTHNNGAPVPPPRALRTARLLLQQQQQITAYESVTAEIANNRISLSEQLQLPTNNILPNFSQLITSNNDHATSSNSISTNHLHSSPQTESTNLSEAPIPLISALEGSTATVETEITNMQMEYISNGSEMLPVISALNLNGQRDEMFVDQERFVTTSPRQNQPLQCHSNNLLNYKLPDMLETNDGDSLECRQLNDEGDEGNDRDYDVEYDDDDDDSSVPNLSIFEQRSSNNDSSLTNVTGTSEENSFELSMNDCSSASNENIPCLSALKP